MESEDGWGEKDMQSVAAAMYLLAIVIQEVQRNVLQAKYVQVCEVLTGVLKLGMNNAAIVKPVLACLGRMIISVDVFTVVVPIFQLLLGFTVDNRPKVRAEAQSKLHEFIVVLSSSCFLNQSPVPPVFFNNLLLYSQTYLAKTDKSSLHAVNFISSIFSINVLPLEISKKIADMILKTISIYRDEMFFKVAIKCIQEYAQKTKQDDDSILLQAHKLAPSNVDLLCIDFLAFFQHVPFTLEGWKVVIDMFESPNATISGFAFEMALKILEFSQVRLQSINNEHLDDVAQITSSILHGQFKPQWMNSFKLLKAFFDVVGSKTNYSCFTRIILLLGQIFDSNQLEDSPPLSSKLKSVFTTAIEKFGIENVVSTLPLHLPNADSSLNDLTKVRGWLIPLIKNAHNSLGFFFSKLYEPALAMQQHTKLDNLQPMQKVLLESICSDIWNSFPVFCQCPVDLDVEFKKKAKILGMLLKESDTAFIWTSVCRGLNNLALSCLTESDIEEQTDKADEESKTLQLTEKHIHYDETILPKMKETLAMFSKNFLPLFYERVGRNPKDKQFPLVSIMSWARLSDAKLVNQSFREALAKWNQNLAPNQRAAVVDISMALCDSLDHQNSAQLVSFISPLLLNMEDPNVQKSAYKILAKIISKNDVQSNEQLIQHMQLWVSAMESCHTNAKKERLKVAAALFYRVPFPQPPEISDLLSAILVEVILCIKDISEKASNIAEDALIVFATLSKKHDCLNDLFLRVIAGLAGTSTHMQACSVNSLAMLLLKFHQDLPDEFFHNACEALLSLFEVKSQEVIKCLLLSCKLLLQFSEKLTEPLRKLMVKGLFFWSDQHISFKRLVKIMLSHVIRRFGLEFVEKFIPESGGPFLKHFVKELEHKKKKQKEHKKQRKNGELQDGSENEEFSHDDEEDLDERNSDGKSNRLWINDGEEMDLLDPSASHFFRSSLPKKSKAYFKVNEDGKLDLMELEEKKPHSEVASAALPSMNSDSENEDSAAITAGTEVKKSVEAKKSQNFSDGSIYRNSKARGDHKVKGRPDPYAFVTLDPRMMNKRKQHEAKSQWDTVMINAAKKGAGKGTQMRKKQKKTR